jgi:hypothetical protein
MHRPPLRICLALALILSAAAGAPAAPPNESSYRRALGTLWNYQACGVRARRAAYRSLAAELAAIERLARSKGLGPTLERLREEYNHMLAISLIMPCAGGPAAALARARLAMPAFRAWVEAQPAQTETDAATAR